MSVRIRFLSELKSIRADFGQVWTGRSVNHRPGLSRLPLSKHQVRRTSTLMCTHFFINMDANREDSIYKRTVNVANWETFLSWQHWLSTKKANSHLISRKETFWAESFSHWFPYDKKGARWKAFKGWVALNISNDMVSFCVLKRQWFADTTGNFWLKVCLPSCKSFAEFPLLHPCKSCRGCGVGNKRHSPHKPSSVTADLIVKNSWMFYACYFMLYFYIQTKGFDKSTFFLIRKHLCVKK